MYSLNITDDFDLKKIAESGQCFRWKELPDHSYNIIHRGKLLNIRRDKESEYILDCSQKEFEEIWKSYFDLDLSYSEIRGLIDKNDDPYLYKASAAGRGIRILNQDAWETLISFIISQRKNIPAIQKAVELLSKEAGKKIKNEIYSFPTAKELSLLSVEDLTGLGMGYRAKYIWQTTRDIVSGAFDMEKLSKLSDYELCEKLKSLYGVGQKVADCVVLFAYHRLNAFPKDVWINRVLENKYENGFSFEKYEPYNGVMQQYLFAMAREDKLSNS